MARWVITYATACGICCWWIHASDPQPFTHGNHWQSFFVACNICSFATSVSCHHTVSLKWSKNYVKLVIEASGMVYDEVARRSHYCSGKITTIYAIFAAQAKFFVHKRQKNISFIRFLLINVSNSTFNHCKRPDMC